MLSNEKYIGQVRLLKANDTQFNYMIEDNHLPIIEKEVYETEQAEKRRRSSVIRTGKGIERKSIKYNSSALIGNKGEVW